jgi:hypothetical protein
MLSRRPHHREAEKQAEARARAYHREIVFAPIRTAKRWLALLKDFRPHCPEDAAFRLRLRADLEEAEPYLADEEGTVRL